MVLITLYEQGITYKLIINQLIIYRTNKRPRQGCKFSFEIENITVEQTRGFL